MSECSAILNIYNDVTFPEGRPEKRKRDENENLPPAKRSKRDEKTATDTRQDRHRHSNTPSRHSGNVKPNNWERKLTGRSPPPRPSSKVRPALATVCSAQNQFEKETPEQRAEREKRQLDVAEWVVRAHEQRVFNPGPVIPLEPLSEEEIAKIDEKLTQPEEDEFEIAEPHEEAKRDRSDPDKLDEGVELMPWPTSRGWAKLKLAGAPHILEFAIDNVPIRGTPDTGTMNYKLFIKPDAYKRLKDKSKWMWKRYAPSGKLNCKLETGELESVTLVPKILLGPAEDPRQNVPPPPPPSEGTPPWPEPKNYSPPSDEDQEEKREISPRVRSKVVMVDRHRKSDRGHFERRHEERRRHSRR